MPLFKTQKEYRKLDKEKEAEKDRERRLAYPWMFCREHYAQIEIEKNKNCPDYKAYYNR